MMPRKWDKKTKNTALFFTILIWMAIYFLVYQNKILFQNVTFPVILGSVLINLLILLLSPSLVPVFDFILKPFARLGSFVFAAVSTVVFFLVLTPIGFFLRISGQTTISEGFDTECDTYYEDWETSGPVDKQF